MLLQHLKLYIFTSWASWRLTDTHKHSCVYTPTHRNKQTQLTQTHTQTHTAYSDTHTHSDINILIFRSTETPMCLNVTLAQDTETPAPDTQDSTLQYSTDTKPH